MCLCNLPACKKVRAGSLNYISSNHNNVTINGCPALELAFIYYWLLIILQGKHSIDELSSKRSAGRWWVDRCSINDGSHKLGPQFGP